MHDAICGEDGRYYDAPGRKDGIHFRLFIGVPSMKMDLLSQGVIWADPMTGGYCHGVSFPRGLELTGSD